MAIQVDGKIGAFFNGRGDYKYDTIRIMYAKHGDSESTAQDISAVYYYDKKTNSLTRIWHRYDDTPVERYLIDTNSYCVIIRIKNNSKVTMNKFIMTGEKSKDGSTGYFCIMDGWGRSLYKNTSSITWEASTLVDGAIDYIYNFPEGESFTLNAYQEYYVAFWPNQWTNNTNFYYDTENTWGKYKLADGGNGYPKWTLVDNASNYPTDMDFAFISSWDEFVNAASTDNYDKKYYCFQNSSSWMPVTYWWGKNVNDRLYKFKKPQNYIGEVTSLPADPNEGDFCKYNNEYRLYNGSNWIATYEGYDWQDSTSYNAPELPTLPLKTDKTHVFRIE